MAETINKQTLSEQIYGILREDILTQRIPVGSKLTLQALKERFQVSQTPIREALTRLVDDELALYYSNVGITTVSLDERDIREIMEMMSEFDCMAIRYCGREYGSDGGAVRLAPLMDELRVIRNAAEAYLKDENMDAWRENSSEFHLVFYRYAHNRRLDSAAWKLRAQMTLLYNQYQTIFGNVQSIHADHMEITSAALAGDFAQAEQCMSQHMAHDMEYALALLNTKNNLTAK